MKNEKIISNRSCNTYDCCSNDRLYKQHRRKQRRRKRNMIIGVIILLLLLIVFLVIVIINKPKEQNEIKEVHKEIQKIQEAESENAKKLLEQCYSSVLSKDKTSFDASVNDKTFSEWLFENFPEKKIEPLFSDSIFHHNNLIS